MRLHNINLKEIINPTGYRLNSSSICAHKSTQSTPLIIMRSREKFTLYLGSIKQKLYFRRRIWHGPQASQWRRLNDCAPFHLHFWLTWLSNSPAPWTIIVSFLLLSSSNQMSLFFNFYLLRSQLSSQLWWQQLRHSTFEGTETHICGIHVEGTWMDLDVQHIEKRALKAQGRVSQIMIP
jgi:hypothetical protein